MKNLIFLSKAFVTIVAMLSIGLSALAHDFEVDGIYYKYIDNNDHSVKVVSGPNKYSGVVSIPATVTTKWGNRTYSVIKIDPWTFSHCTELKGISIPNSIDSIHDSTFEYCTGLTSITIPNSVTSIGSSAFYNCSGLTSVTIPNSVTSIGEYAFHNTGWYNNQPDGILYLDNCCLGYKGDMPIGTLAIKDGTRLIGKSAFYKCTGLTEVTIPNSVTKIGRSAFFGCTGIKSVSIPNSVTTIDSHAFYICKNLFKVNITDLSAWCKIDFAGYDSNPLCNTERLYTGHLYLNDTKIEDLVIPNDITLIKDYAFNYCDGLTSVTIPNSVTTIGRNTFSHCTGLTSVTIGKSVTKIGDYAFYAVYGVSKLNEIVSLNPEPPTCGGDCFYHAHGDCILKVPAGAKEAYSAAVGWSQFTNIIEIAIVEVSTQGDNATFEIPTAVDAVKYTVKVYSDAEMTQLIATANYDADGKIMPMSTSLELSIDGFADGTYYYSVSALSENGVELENHTGEFVINVATGIGNASIENKTTEVARYDIYGRLLSKPTKGVNIVKMSDGTTKKLIIKN